MALTYGFYDSVDSDRVYNAEQVSSLFDGIIEDGVIAGEGGELRVYENTLMSVKVDTGRAWFDHTWTLNDGWMNFDITAAHALLNRWDIVYIEVNSASRTNSMGVLDGTPATEPVLPTLTNTATVHQYPLAYVYVAAGVTDILQAAITNKVGTAETPFSTGILQSIDWEDQLDVIRSQLITGPVDVTDYVRSTGLSVPASGAGIELAYSSNTGYVIAYDRTGDAFKIMQLLGSSIHLYPEGGSVQIGNAVNYIQIDPDGDLTFVGTAGIRGPSIHLYPEGGNVLIGSAANHTQIAPNGNLNFVGTAGLLFGSFWGYVLLWVQANAVQFLWYDISDPEDIGTGRLNGITHDGAGKLTVLTEGAYEANWYGSFSADAIGVEVQVALSVNGAETSMGLNRYETMAANKPHPFSGMAILDLAANDTVNLSIMTPTAGTPDLGIDVLGLVLKQIGGKEI